MDWNSIRYFIELVEKETLSAAAVHLNVQHSTVSRQIVQLERNLGLRLFDRIGKRYLLTKDGERIYCQAREIGKDINVLKRIAQEQIEMPHQVILSSPPLVTHFLLMPHLSDFYKLHPNIHLNLQSEASIINLYERQADIALRIVRPQQNDLAMRRVFNFSYRIYAHQAYLQDHKREEWEFIQINVEANHRRWFMEKIRDEAKIVFSSNEFTAVKQAVCDQIGIGLIPDFAVSPLDCLQEVKLSWETEIQHLPADIYLVMHEDVRRSPFVRTVADFFAERMSK